jgi:ABC-type glycerol-3-phosphate transport system substrate-binding protein
VRVRRRTACRRRDGCGRRKGVCADLHGAPQRGGHFQRVLCWRKSISTVSGAFGSSSSVSTMGGGEGAELALYRANADGSGCTRLESYMPMTLPEGSQGNVDISHLCADAEGNLWVAESVMAYHYELPEGFSGTDEEKQQYYKNDGQQYALRKLDPSGAELLSVDLAGTIDDPSQFYPTGLVCDAGGSVYFAGSDNVHVFDINGTELFSLQSPSWISQLIVTSDGAAAAACYEETGFAVKPVDAAAKSWGTSIPGEMSTVYPGGGDYYFYYTLGSSLYGYREDTSESERILGWLDCDIDQDTIRALGLLSNGAILCTAYGGENGGELILLAEQDASVLTEKTVLTLATMSLDSALRKQVLQFNRQSEQYRIEVRDYSEYNTTEDYMAGLMKMNAEIIAGHIPDILDVSRLPVGQYAGKGLLEDLYPYIDSDPELSREGLVDSVMKALEQDGGLYQVSPSFGILSLVGRADVVGEDMGWTLDEMNAVLSEQPEGTQLLDQYITKSDILYYLCAMNMNRYMDWSQGTCSFDSGDFIQVLQFCDTFPDEVDMSGSSYGDQVSGVQSGKKILTMSEMSDFESIQLYEAMFGGDVIYKGFPREDGVGNVVYVSSGLGMSTACSDKDGAWSFLRTLLTEEYQESGDIWSFPTNKAAFDNKLERAMEKETITDEQGNEIEVSSSGIGVDGFFVELYAVTQEQADKIMALIDSADTALVFDDNVMNIVRDEAAAYFAGEKTAEDTAALIQNRVGLYINEQK